MGAVGFNRGQQRTLVCQRQSELPTIHHRVPSWVIESVEKDDHWGAGPAGRHSSLAGGLAIRRNTPTTSASRQRGPWNFPLPFLDRSKGHGLRHHQLLG